MASEPMRPENVRYGSGEYSVERSTPIYHGLAEAKGYSQDHSRVAKMKYSHDAMIDVIVAEPRITQNELAAKFGYSVPWVSRIIGSDAFQAALAKRREEISDPFLIATVSERLNGLAMQSLDVIAEKLQATQSADIALKALDISSKALGFGARERTPANVQNNFVVQMPGKAISSEDWAKSHGQIVEAVKSLPEPSPLSTTITRDPLDQPREMRTVKDSK